MLIVNKQSNKYKNLYAFFVSNKGYISPFFPYTCEKSLYPYLLGIRSSYFYYNLINSFPAINISLNVLESSIMSECRIVFCDNVNFLSNLNNIANKKNNIHEISSFFLEKLYLPDNLNLILLNYKFRSIQKIKKENMGLILMHGFSNVGISEAKSKTTPFVGVGCFTLNGVTYPFNANIKNKVLTIWYLYVLLSTIRRGLYRRKKKKNEI